MLLRILFILSTLSFSAVLIAAEEADEKAFESIFPQCSHASAQSKICEFFQTDSSKKELYQLNHQYKNIAIAAGVSENESFLTHLKTNINQQLDEQVNKLKDFQSCIKSDACPAQKEFIRKQLKKNWKKMRKALALKNITTGNAPVGKKQKTQRGTRTTYLYHPQPAKLKFNVQSRNNSNKSRFVASNLKKQFPIIKHNKLKHINGLEFTESISPLSPAERAEINKSFQSAFNLQLSYNLSNETNKHISSELKELEQSQNYEESIQLFLKKLLSKLALVKDQKAPEYKAIKDIVDFTTKKIASIRQEADQDYIDSLSDNPIIAYIDNFDPDDTNVPSNDELAKAVQKIIDKAQGLKDRAANKLNVSDALGQFTPIVQQTLAQDESHCGIAKSIFDKKEIRDKKYEFWTKTARTVGNAGCFASLFLPVAGVTICALGNGLSSIAKGLEYQKQKGLNAGHINQSFSEDQKLILTNKTVAEDVEKHLETKQAAIQSAKESTEAVITSVGLVRVSKAYDKSIKGIDKVIEEVSSKAAKLKNTRTGAKADKALRSIGETLSKTKTLATNLRNGGRTLKVVLPLLGRFAPRTLASGAVAVDNTAVNEFVNNSSLTPKKLLIKAAKEKEKSNPCSQRYEPYSNKLYTCINLNKSTLSEDDKAVALEVFDSIEASELDYTDQEFSELSKLFELKPNEISGAKSFIPKLRARSSEKIAKNLEKHEQEYEKNPNPILKLVIELSRAELKARADKENEAQTGSSFDDL